MNQWNNEKVITTRSEHGSNTCWPGRSLWPHGPLSGWLTRLLNSCQWWRDLWDPGQHRGLSFGIFVPLAPPLKSAADIWTHTHIHSSKRSLQRLQWWCKSLITTNQNFITDFDLISSVGKFISSETRNFTSFPWALEACCDCLHMHHQIPVI